MKDGVGRNGGRESCCWNILLERRINQKENKSEKWAYSSVIEHLLGPHKVLVSIPTTEKAKGN